MEEQSISILSSTPKRARLDTNWNKCALCQNVTEEGLFEGSEIAVNNVIEAARTRQDSVHNRLRSVDVSIVTFLFHQNCYKIYTSKTNLKCYKKLSLLPRKPENVYAGGDNTTPIAEELKSRIEQNINPQKCFFCQKITHKKAKCIPGHSDPSRIREAAKIRKDDELLANLENINYAEFRYHKSCYASYISLHNIDQVTKECDSSLYDAAFECLLSEIVPKISSGQVLNLSSITQTYNEILTNQFSCSESPYHSKNMKRRLINYFGEGIIIQPQEDPSKPHLVYSRNIQVKDAVQTVIKLNDSLSGIEASLDCNLAEESDKLPDHHILYHAAMLLHNDLTKSIGICTNPLKTCDINDKEAERVVPDSLYVFLRWLIEGPDKHIPEGPFHKQHSANPAIHRVIMSLAQDLVYASSRNLQIPPKHAGLAIAIRHFTGSKFLVTLLNHFGHSISYDVLERIDTAMANDVIKHHDNGAIIPPNITFGPIVQAAIDNLNISEETVDGKRRTDSTTEVLYQIDGGHFSSAPLHNERYDGKARDRAVKDHSHCTQLRQFSKDGKNPQPEILLGKGSSLSDIVQQFSSEIKRAKSLDRVWVFARLDPTKLFRIDLEKYTNEFNQTVPSWGGFNVKITVLHTQKTSVGYCPIIPANPTEYSTVYTCMKTIQHQMGSLNQKWSIITADEAIYSKLKVIQWKRPKEFEHVIIRMGAMHIEMNFMSCIGKIYGDSGLEDIWIEADIYGPNTVNHIMNGKAYYKCSRGHKLMYEAKMRVKINEMVDWLAKEKKVEILDVLSNTMEDVKVIREAMANGADTNHIKEQLRHMSLKMDTLEEAFEAFNEAGAHKPNFKFAQQYLNMIELLLQFQRAEREGNWNLHLSTCARMIPYMFACDHVNYSRWLTEYVTNMLQLPQLAPDIYNYFMQGHHSLSRTGNPFSKVSSDMLLEQSINCDAKSKGGIIGFSLNAAANSRWFLTRHMKAEISSNLKKMAGINKATSVHIDINENRMNKDESDVRKITTFILNSGILNMFKIEELPNELANVLSGVVAGPEISTPLLSMQGIGEKAMNNFVKDRLDTTNGKFFDPVKKLNLPTFASLRKKVKAKSKDAKSVIAGDRDLFHRLVVIGEKRKVSLKNLLSYELTAVPLSIANPNGTLTRTNKSKLLSKLEAMIPQTSNMNTEAVHGALLVDAMALIKVISPQNAKNFDEYGEKILAYLNDKLKKHCRIDIIFDRYDKEMSIKAAERNRRGGNNGAELLIHSGQTQLPQNWTNFCNKATNKRRLTNFLSNFIVKSKSQLSDRARVILAGGFDEITKTLCVTSTESYSVPGLQSTHEEADTRIILHAAHAAREFDTVTIWSPDTDVVVLATYFMNKIGAKNMFVNIGSGEKSRMLNLNKLSASLSRPLRMSLLGLHAITGCDSVSSFCRIGKMKPVDVFMENPKLFTGLQELGKSKVVSKNCQDSLEKFICTVYDRDKNISGVNELRYKLFCTKQAKNENLPPTKDALQQHILRSNYQCFIWRKALERQPCLPEPIDHGWELCDGSLEPVWTKEPTAPEEMLQLVRCQCKKTQCLSRCACMKLKLPCTSACNCMGEDSCMNEYGEDFEDESDDDEDM